MTDAHQKENKNLWVGPTLIFYEARELMNESDNGCSTKPPEITVEDGSVTIVTSKPPADLQDDTLDAWFDRAQKARERMAVDEAYRKEVAKRIS